MSDVVASGAVFIPAIMPTGVRFSDINETVGQQIASVLNQFTSQGVEVWLRFAHEVNYYVMPDTNSAGNGPEYAGGSEQASSVLNFLVGALTCIPAQAEFTQAWQTVHDAVATNPRILMFWSPNADTVDNLTGWWPGADYVDIVGMDNYPDPGATFASAYGAFYDEFANQYSKHFCIGETGVKNGGSIANKEAWVTELAKTNVSAYPCYKSTIWFEFDKAVDFRIIQGQSQSTITETLSNFA